MNDFLPLPPPEREAAAVHVAAGFLDKPPAPSHSVQFYDSEAFLCETVARFTSAGLDAGDRVLLIATAEHTQGILERLDPERTARALREGQLSFHEARRLLQPLIDGPVDGSRLEAVLRRLVAEPVQSKEPRRLRAFGEMVDVLWRDGHSRAALRLEEVWGQLVQEQQIMLLCSYASAHFHASADTGGFFDVCGTHTHVMPTEAFSQLSDEARLREISVLQQRARVLEGEIRQRKAAESALREVLERRAQVETELRASLEREQEARLQAQANDAFKEVFMGILGHDLRNPLNTILTTARLMTLRGELASDSQKRLDRMIASGVRMQRMIEQILDMARDRLAAGIAVSRSAPRDLRPLVGKIVEEMRLAHPGRQIELRCEGRCFASVDADRLEQVVSNLLGNAATHGDPARPIQVCVAELAAEFEASAVSGTSAGVAAAPSTAGGAARACARISLSVRNYGAPIDPAFLPLLFDPFRRQRKPEGRSAGLGLGLYISERIVRAHGGTLRVESSECEGTLFEAILPSESPPALRITSDEPSESLAAPPDAAPLHSDEQRSRVPLQMD